MDLSSLLVELGDSRKGSVKRIPAGTVTGKVEAMPSGFWRGANDELRVINRMFSSAANRACRDGNPAQADSSADSGNQHPQGTHRPELEPGRVRQPGRHQPDLYKPDGIGSACGFDRHARKGCARLRPRTRPALETIPIGILHNARRIATGSPVRASASPSILAASVPQTAIAAVLLRISKRQFV